MNGLRFDIRGAALKGGYGGRAILPHDSAGSPLVQRVSSGQEGFRMPPTEPRLTGDEIALLRAWIDQGAPWPQGKDEATGAGSAWREHWAFQPIQRPTLPAVRQAAWVRNPIDLFVLAKLESEGVKPSPAADKSTLLRRVSLDLTGLPPTLSEMRAFLEDAAPGAYGRLVDRLLESRHYGEKWGAPLARPGPVRRH